MFTGIDRNNREITFTPNSRERIDLRQLGLVSLDLAPLKEWEYTNRIRFLILRENYLNEIDLRPLKYFTDLEVIALDRNSIRKIDLSPLKHCKRLNKLYLYHNFLTKIDLKPLENLESLAGIFLHGNPLFKIDLGCLPPNIKRINLNQRQKVINADSFLHLITHESEPRPEIPIRAMQTISSEDHVEKYYEDSDYLLADYDDYRSPNDQRSDIMNPNNPEYKATQDNRANQLNPKHPAYHSSRRKGG